MTGVGPYLITAALCNEVRWNVDGSFDLVTLVDSLGVDWEGADPPRDFAITRAVYCYFSLNAGGLYGIHDVIVRLIRPDGTEREMLAGEWHFSPGERIAALREVELTIEHVGQHWWEIHVSGKRISRLLLGVERSSRGGHEMLQA